MLSGLGLGLGLGSWIPDDPKSPVSSDYLLTTCNKA